MLAGEKKTQHPAARDGGGRVLPARRPLAPSAAAARVEPQVVAGWLHVGGGRLRVSSASLQRYNNLPLCSESGAESARAAGRESRSEQKARTRP